MKTKTFSNNRVTRSHSARPAQPTAPRHRVSEAASSTASVSKRDSDAILRQARQIRETWTNAERDERAQMGAQRRAELCQLLFGAN